MFSVYYISIIVFAN